MPETRSFFSPKRRRREPEELEQRLTAMEEALLRVGEQQFAIIDPVTGQPTGIGSDANGGVVVDGGGGGGVLPSHEVLNNAYHVDASGETPVAQDLIVRNSSGLWARLAVGTTGYVLKVVAGAVAWAQVAHSELTGIGANDHHNQAHTFFGTDHSDVTGTPATGDLIYRNGSSQWTKLAASTNGFFLYLAAGLPAWVQLAFSHITGVITAAQHDNLASTAGTTADHTGTLSANARVAVKKNGTLVATRRGVNLIEGTNITLTVADDSGNEEVDVTIDAAAGGAGTVVVQEGDVTVDAAAGTLDFAAADFNVTSSPAGEANIAWQGFTVEEGNASVATDIKTLDFGSGFDVSASGGEADVTLDLSEVVSGDVDFTGNASVLGAITYTPGYSRAVNFTATPAQGSLFYINNSTEWDSLTRGADKTLLRAGVGTNQLEYASLDTVLSGGATDPRIVEYTLWRRISAAAATGAASEVPMFESVNTGVRMPAAGKIIGIGITAAGDIGSAGNNIAATVYKATSDGGAYASTAATVTLSGGAGTERSASDLSASVSFNAGDILTVYDAETGTVNAVGIIFTIYVKFNV